MSNQVLILATAILIGLAGIGLGFSILRLRRETILSSRTWMLGAGVPLVATLGYLLLGGPPFHWLVIVVVGAVGVAITAAMGASRSLASARQTGLTLALWSIAYVAAALTAFIPRADPQALMAVLLALSAGLAVGTQVGLAIRGRQRAMPAPAFVSAGGPQVSWNASVEPIAPPPIAVAPPVEPIAPPPAPVEPTVEAIAPPPIAVAPPVEPIAPPPIAVAPPVEPIAPPPAPVEPPADPIAPPPIAVAPPEPPAAAEPIHFTHGGGRFLFGYTATYIGIWDLANRQGALIQYPRSPEGRVAAWSQFTIWEPRTALVMPYPGLPLEPIADGVVTFSHVGARFAFGHTQTEHAIWDRWAPGPPVARFSLDPQAAAQAWQTFTAWEPAAMQL